MQPASHSGWTPLPCFPPSALDPRGPDRDRGRTTGPPGIFSRRRSLETSPPEVQPVGEFAQPNLSLTPAPFPGIILSPLFIETASPHLQVAPPRPASLAPAPFWGPTPARLKPPPSPRDRTGSPRLRDKTTRVKFSLTLFFLFRKKRKEFKASLFASLCLFERSCLARKAAFRSSNPLGTASRIGELSFLTRTNPNGETRGPFSRRTPFNFIFDTVARFAHRDPLKFRPDQFNLSVCCGVVTPFLLLAWESLSSVLSPRHLGAHRPIRAVWLYYEARREALRLVPTSGSKALPVRGYRVPNRRPVANLATAASGEPLVQFRTVPFRSPGVSEPWAVERLPSNNAFTIRTVVRHGHPLKPRLGLLL